MVMGCLGRNNLSVRDVESPVFHCLTLFGGAHTRGLHPPQSAKYDTSLSGRHDEGVVHNRKVDGHAGSARKV